MREFLVLTFAIGLAVAAHAEKNPQTAFGMKDPNAPIDVTADNFDADANANTATYSGNVVVHQGDVRMRANKVRVNIVDGKPVKLFADGNVVVDAPSGTAIGDNGVYDVNPRLVTLTGHVVMTKDKNVMRGSVLIVNLLTGKATLDNGKQHGRVQGLFTPPPQKADNP